MFYFLFLGNVAVFFSNKDTVCIFLFLISAARKTNWSFFSLTNFPEARLIDSAEPSSLQR